MNSISTLDAPTTYAITVGHITANITESKTEDGDKEWCVLFWCGNLWLGRDDYYDAPTPGAIYQQGWEYLVKELETQKASLQICKQDPANQGWFPIGIEVPA
jgi:hypothetical protein